MPEQTLLCTNNIPKAPQSSDENTMKCTARIKVAGRCKITIATSPGAYGAPDSAPARIPAQPLAAFATNDHANPSRWVAAGRSRPVSGGGFGAAGGSRRVGSRPMGSRCRPLFCKVARGLKVDRPGCFFIVFVLFCGSFPGGPPARQFCCFLLFFVCFCYFLLVFVILLFLVIFRRNRPPRFCCF